MFLRYVVEAPIELLVETLQKSCEDFARQRVTFAEDARRFVVETSMYCDGLNQVAAVILAAKKVIFVGGLRELELEADCSGVVCIESTGRSSVEKVTKPKLRPGRSRTSSMVPWCPNNCLRTASTLSSFGGRFPT